MAQKNRAPFQKKQTLVQAVPLISALVAGLTGIFATLLLTFYQFDQSPFYYSTQQAVIHNRLGFIGAYISAYFFYWFGVSAYLLIPFGFVMAYLIWHKKTVMHDLDRIMAACCTFLSVSVLSYVYGIGSIDYMIPGGIVGQNLFFIIRSYVDGLIVQIFMWIVLAASCIIIAQVSFSTVFTALVQALYYVVRYIKISAVPFLKSLKKGSLHLMSPLHLLYKQLKRFIYGTDVTDSSVSVFAFEQAAHDNQIDHSLFAQPHQTVHSQITAGQLDDAIFMPEHDEKEISKKKRRTSAQTSCYQEL